MSKDITLCPLCSIDIVAIPYSPTIMHIKCKICGEFEISRTALNMLENSGSFLYEKRYLLSGISRNESEKDNIIKFDSNNIKEFVNSLKVPKSPFEKMDMILIYIHKKTSYEGEYVRIGTEDYPIAYAKNCDEMGYFLEILRDKLCYVENPDSEKYRLTIEGWKRLAEISKEQPDSDQVFVAMWFNEEMNDAWENGFKKAIEEAGYKILRIDKEEFSDKICDRIIKEIRRSGLLIADLTGFRSGVFFEAGFAKGLGIPVIWTCHKDDFKKLSEHFDTRQYNCIEWEKPENLKKQLINRIEAEYPKKKE